jgi:hydrogenase/urease accessory protein HupE
MLIPAGNLLLPAEVFAHSLSKRFGDFYGGLLHPLTSVELGLGILAIALVVGQQGKPGARSTLGWFFAALGAGAAAAPWLPVIEAEIRLGGLVATTFLGVLAAIALRLPRSFLPLFGLVLGLLFGLANGLAMSAETAAHLFIAGVLAGGVLAITPVAALVTTLERRWQQTGVRVIGSWIAASGLLVIAFQLRGLFDGSTAA